MKTTTREQADAIVRKDDRNEPPEPYVPGENLRHGKGTPDDAVHNTGQKDVSVSNPNPTDRGTTVIEAVRAELENHDTAVWFALLCEQGPDAIEQQAWQLQAELKDRGIKAGLRDVQDAMLQLAYELLPDSPAGIDPRDRLTHDLGRWATGQPPEVQGRLRVLLEGPGSTGAFAGSLASLRAFLRKVCTEALEKEAA